MFDPEFLQSNLFNWLILPLLIFTSRLFDVSLGTMRHIFIARGFRNIVPVFGFFEVLIWLIAISQVMKNLNNAACYLAWAGGFAAGTYLGMYIEHKLALGTQVLRIITHRDCADLIAALRQEQVGLTIINGEGSTGPVKILFAIIKRKNFIKIGAIIENHNPNAFYTLEDVRTANQGVFPELIGKPEESFYYFRKLFPVRKGK